MARIKTVDLTMDEVAIINDALTFYANYRDRNMKPGMKKEVTEKIRNTKKDY